ncbi:MAG TPA: hypothetical protein VM432_10770 [Bdellovibrionales bacterium]|jgi:hypothetical protein|nr:hypothetical protein [Bdellovibrionales bacterium]
MKLVYILIALLFPMTSLASTVTTTMKDDAQMPGLFRFGLIGAAMPYKIASDYENKNDSKAIPASATITAAVGRGTFSFETGVAYYQWTETATRNDETGASKRYLLNSQYIGVPLAVKWNYIEAPLSTFFIKLGATAMSLLGQSTGEEFALTPEQTTFAVVGLGGTTDLSESVAFVVDLSLMRDLGEENHGIPQMPVSLGVGFSYDL